MRRFLSVIFLLEFTICYATICFADEIELERIVVTPTQTEEMVGKTGDSVTVFTMSNIEGQNLETVKDMLKETPGLHLVEAGKFGGLTSAFMRGSDSGQVKVMIDGVRVYDPISTNSAFDFAFLSLDNIERIEIVRGPQTTLYGSDAIGGAINVITKKGKGKPTISLLGEGGSYYTSREALESQGKINKFSYSLGLSNFKTRGLSKLRDTSEKDAMRTWSLSSRLDYELTDDIAFGYIGRYTDARYEYDSSIGAKDDSDLFNKTAQSSQSIYFQQKILENWQHKIQASAISNYRQDANDKDSRFPDDYLSDWYLGKNYQIDWINTFKPNSILTTIAGFNWQKEIGDYYYYSEYLGGSTEADFPKVFSRTRAWYIENLLDFDKLNISGTYRLDKHSQFKYHDTYKINFNYKLFNQTKIKGGFATGYKAPTLYQLNAISDPWFGGGNPNLKPEESETYEAGFAQSFLGEKIKLETTYFRSHLKNLIDAKYHPDTWLTDQYSNIGKARNFGFENIISVKPIKEIEIICSYDWLDTENKDTHDELLRRPKNRVNLNANFRPSEKFSINLNTRYVGHAQDSANRLLKSYVKLDLSSNYNLNKNLEIFSHIDNLLDTSYEEIKDYTTPGFSMFGGLKLKF
ncbi:MAG: TonB-dependent receptor [Candidatus Omnitrophota bacterium]